MPQNFSDLGLSSDKILSITRVSGDGSAGSLDTYNVKTRANPSGAGLNFYVQNGNDGLSGGSFSHSVPNVDTTNGLSEYINQHYQDLGFETAKDAWLSLSSVVCTGSTHSLGRTTDMRLELLFAFQTYDDLETGEFQYLMAYDGANWVDVDAAIEDLELAEPGFILTFVNESVASFDTSVNRSSTNAVENKAIGNAVSVGIDYYYTVVGGVKMAQVLPNAKQSYYPDLDQYVSVGLPFYDNEGPRHPAYKYVGHAIENIDPSIPQATADCKQYISATIDQYTDGVIFEMVTFNTTNKKVNRKFRIEIEQATNADIDALF